MSTSDRITPPPRCEDAQVEPETVDEERVGAAVDWDHLSRQTFGDRELEQELLTLFSAQAASLAARLAEAAGGGAGRREIAHTLQGSARAIGAFDLANAAQDYERALNAGDGRVASRRDELMTRLEDARAAIALRLAGR